MLPESEMCRSDADVCSLMAALSGDLGVIDLKFTSKSKLEFSLLKTRRELILCARYGRSISLVWTLDHDFVVTHKEEDKNVKATLSTGSQLNHL